MAAINTRIPPNKSDTYLKFKSKSWATTKSYAVMVALGFAKNQTHRGLRK
ncbi:MAG: hypothetical protein IPP49_02015 [Saprospiraceae bacterium]|nr:hypothetical protein [Saprospiraceae bacterium]